MIGYRHMVVLPGPINALRGPPLDHRSPRVRGGRWRPFGREWGRRIMGGDRDGAPEVPDGRTEAPRSPPSAMSRLRELLDISDATSLTQSPTPSRARDRAVRTGDAGG